MPDTSDRAGFAASSAAKAAAAVASEPPDQSAGAESAASAMPPEIDLMQVVNGLQDEVAALNDKVLRAHAEMENMRKRADREKIDTAKYAITKFATDIVTVGDNLGRALDAVSADAIGSNPALKALVDGVTMTDRALVAALDRHGVKRIDPAGEVFNPHLHQAIAQITDTKVAAGTIVQVHQSGYTIEDRVLRPAMVVVAQGGFKPIREPKPAAQSETASPTQGATAEGTGSSVRPPERDPDLAG